MPACILLLCRRRSFKTVTLSVLLLPYPWEKLHRHVLACCWEKIRVFAMGVSQEYPTEECLPRVSYKDALQKRTPRVSCTKMCPIRRLSCKSNPQESLQGCFPKVSPKSVSREHFPKNESLPAVSTKSMSPLFHTKLFTRRL